MIKLNKIKSVVCDTQILFFTDEDIKDETEIIGYYYEYFNRKEIERNSKYGLYIQTHMKEGS